jgi:hypothetical protein
MASGGSREEEIAVIEGYLRAPPICFWVLPEVEREHGQLVSWALDDMAHLVSSFREALALADYCDANRDRPTRNEADRQFIRWKQIAGRDAALTVYKFYEVRQTLSAQWKASPVLHSYVDRASLSEAGKLFESYFRGYGAARQGAAHAGKLYQNPKIAQANTIGGLTIQNMMSERATGSVIDGKMGSVSLTQESAGVLQRVAESTFEAYQAVADRTRVLDLQEPKGTLQP